MFFDRNTKIVVYSDNQIAKICQTQGSLNPQKANWRYLQILWTRGLATVREVHEELAKTKDVGYTTTLKLMQIMHEKGLVKRDDSMRTHIYQAAVNKEKTQRHLLSKMIDSLFGGSPYATGDTGIGR